MNIRCLETFEIRAGCTVGLPPDLAVACRTKITEVGKGEYRIDQGKPVTVYPGQVIRISDHNALLGVLPSQYEVIDSENQPSTKETPQKPRTAKTKTAGA